MASKPKLTQNPNESASSASYSPELETLAKQHSTPEGDPSVRRKLSLRELVGRVKRVPLTEKRMAEKLKTQQKPDSTEHQVAHTPDAIMPDPDAPRVGKEVLTEEDEKKAS